MAKLFNHTKRPITLPTLHVIPANGFNDQLSNETIRSPDNWPNLTGKLITGEMSVEFDAEVEEINPVVPVVVAPVTPAPEFTGGDVLVEEEQAFDFTSSRA